jgi:hypothetical protein
MAQQQTGVGTKTTTPPNNQLDYIEVNAINDTVNANATDAETRIANLEGTSTGILSYATVDLPASVLQQGTIAYDLTLQELVYFKNGEWYKTTDNTQVTNLPNFWTPAELITAYWWDASDAGTITESANAVASWTDKNQSAVLSQGNATNQPVTNVQTINGLNVIDFQGDDYLPGPILALTEFTKLVVFSFTSSDQNNTATHASGTGDAFWENNTGFLNVFHSGNVLTSTTAMTPGQTFLGGTTKATNGDTELFVYGNSEGTVNAPLGTGSLPFQIGSYNTGFFLNGKIAEVILLPSVITLSDRQKAEGYLAHKWGFTADLDAGHPYKTSAPTI